MDVAELPEGPVTVMFTDVEGSTTLRTTLGDAVADQLFKEHDELIRELIAQHRGQDLKAALGDGFLAIFVSTRRALTCAVAIQQAIDKFNRERPGPELKIRIGLNTGEVAWQNGQPSGEAIHAASRVCASASGGEVFVSDVTRQLAGTMPDVAFTDRGEFDLKGFPQPWKLWSLSWRSAVADAPHDVFVGREAELSELRRRLREAIEGHGSLVLVGGEPGVGKTTLVRQLIKEAEKQGAVALFGRCYESSGTVPYSPFVETTEQALQIVPPEWVREDLGEDAAEVARMVPELRRRFPDIGEPLDLPPEQQRRYFFNAISAFITRGSQRAPIVLVVDDAHWADEPTLLLIEHVAELFSNLRILAIGTYRDVELDVSRPLAATLERLVRARLAHRIPLKRFDKASVADLLEAHSGRKPPDALVEVIFSETEGNAFFVDEVFRHLVEEGKIFDSAGEYLTSLEVDELDVPESVRLVVGRRIERLGEAAQRVLAAGAVVGRGFEFALLERIADVDTNTLLDVVEEAEQARVIVPEDRGGRIYYTFGHELIRQTLLASLSLPRRQRLHLSIATALEETDPAMAETRPSELANHLLQAGTAADRDRTLDYLRRAAHRALDAAAFEEAMRATEAALSLMRAGDSALRLDVLEQLGWAERGLGHFERCIELWTEVADGRAEMGDVDAAARLLWEVGYQLIWLGRFDDAFSAYARATELLGDEPTATRAMVVGGMATLVGFAGLWAASEPQFDAALRIAEKAGDARTLGLTHWGHCVAAWSNARFNEAAAAGRQAVDLLREAGDLWTLADALGWLSFPLALQGRGAEARDAAQEGVEIADKVGHQVAGLLARRGVVIGNSVAGITPAELVAFAEEDLRRMSEVNGPWVCQSHAFLAAGYLGLGNLDKARHSADAAMDTEPESAWKGPGLGLRFLTLATARDDEACRAMLDETFTSLPRSLDTASSGTSAASTAVAEGCALLGWAAEAMELLPVVEALAADSLMRIFDGASLRRIAGMITAAAERWDESVEHFETALAQIDEYGYRHDAGQIYHRYGEMLLHRGNPEDRPRAQEFLALAIDDYRTRGMELRLAEAEATARTLN